MPHLARLLNRDLPCQPLPVGGCYQPAQTVENWLTESNSYFLFTNVDGHIPGIPALERNYASLQLAAEKRFSNQWQMMGSYTYARLTGNYSGDDRAGAADFAVSSLVPFNYVSGPLPNDIRHAVKLFGSYQLKNLNTGIAFYFQTGRPINRAFEAVQRDFAASTILQEPRGASGRLDSITSVDLHADYNLPIFRDERITIGADVFNVFNFQSVTAVGEIEWTQWSDGGLETHLDFLQPIDTQPGRTVRILLRYSF